MLKPLKHTVRALAATLLIAGISACSARPSAMQPTPISTSVPIATIAAPQPTLPKPTTAPTMAVPAATTALLPAPMYFLDSASGQLMRIERDGTTKHQITKETEKINVFAVRPTDGALVYDVGEWNTDKRAIVYADAQGQNRVELISGPVSSPIFSPKGDRIAFITTAPTKGWEIGKDTSAAGVWTTTSAGGRPSQMIANDPVPDPDHAPEGARTFSPLAWSPDEQSLLLFMVPNRGNGPAGDIGGAGMAVLHSDGTLVEIAKLGEQPRACVDGTWSQDSSSILCANSYEFPNSPALWRADTRTGAAEELIKSKAGDSVLLAGSAQQISDKDVLLFQATNANTATQASEFTMQRLRLGGASQTLNPTKVDFGGATGATWAPDRSGAVTVMNAPNGLELWWIPANGEPSTKLPITGFSPIWGK